MSDIEILGTSAVEDLISRTDYLVPHISKKDREPSWDGFIYAYNKASNNHSNEDFIGRVPVQIKCRKCNSISEKASFSAEINNLSNYLTDGGVILFVVEITNEYKKVVWYINLLPYDLKKILKNHGNQVSYALRLKEFPSSKNEITDLILNFIQDRDKQRTAINSEEVTIDELEKSGELKNISFGFTTVDKEKYKSFRMPMDYFFNHELYLYANLSHSISLPVEHVERISAAARYVKKKISVNGVEYYSEFKVLYTKDTEEFQFGNSLKIIFNSKKHTGTFQYTLKGSLTERIRDEEFIIEAFEKRGIEFDDDFIPLLCPSDTEVKEFRTEDRKEHLDYLKRCKKVFDVMHVKKDLNCDDLEKIDYLNLDRLVSAIADKNLVPLKDIGQIAGMYKVGNISLLVFILKDKDTQLFRVYDFFDSPLRLEGVDSKGNKYASTPCVRLVASALLNCDNMDPTTILREIEKVHYSALFESDLISFMLEVLKAYDVLQLSEHPYLKLAEDISDYIHTNSDCPNTAILILNKLQIRKRKRQLTEEELQELKQVIEQALLEPVNDEILTGAYLLNNDIVRAKAHFDNLNDVRKNEFSKYPICRFAKWMKN